MKHSINKTQDQIFDRENLIDLILGIVAFLMGATFFIYIAQVPF